MTGRRLKKLDEQLEAVEAINLARSIYGFSYRDLSELLGIPESLICRYANGDLLPSIETARFIRERLGRLLDLAEVVRKFMTIHEGFVDLSNVLLNPSILRLYAKRVKDVFSGVRVTKVLTVAADGIPLSVMASCALNAKLAIAKPYKDLSASDFYEVTYVVESPPRKVTLYLPKCHLTSGDRVLLVDDIVRTGRTLTALTKFVEEAGASLVGVSVLISLNKAVTEELRRRGVLVDVVLEL